jgi:hypothetical protein
VQRNTAREESKRGKDMRRQYPEREDWKNSESKKCGKLQESCEDRYEKEARSKNNYNW